MSFSIMIVSFLRSAPTSPRLAPGADCKIRSHGIHEVTNADTHKFFDIYQQLVLAEAGHLNEDKSVNIVQEDQLKSLNIGSLALTYFDKTYSLWYIGQHIERGWISNSTAMRPHKLGYFVALSAANTVCNCDQKTDEIQQLLDKAQADLHANTQLLDALMRQKLKNLSLITEISSDLSDMKRDIVSKDHEIARLREELRRGRECVARPRNVAQKRNNPVDRLAICFSELARFDRTTLRHVDMNTYLL